MTRELAIEILKHDIYLDKQERLYNHNATGIEALEMAIKALEQYQEQGSRPGCWLDKDGNVIEVHSWQEWMNYMKVRKNNE